MNDNKREAQAKVQVLNMTKNSGICSCSTG